MRGSYTRLLPPPAPFSFPDQPGYDPLLTSTGEPLGRITFELFKDVVPKTAENFRQFCTGESKDAAGRPQGYKSSKFHRIVSLPVRSSRHQHCAWSAV